MKIKLVCLCEILTCMFMVSCAMSMDEKILNLEKVVTQLEEHQFDETDDEWTDIMDKLTETRDDIDDKKEDLKPEQLNRVNKLLDKASKLAMGHKYIMRLIEKEQELLDNWDSWEPLEAINYLGSILELSKEIDKHGPEMARTQYDRAALIAKRIIEKGNELPNPYQ